MKWCKPSWVALNMNAEIGSYSEDFGGDYVPLIDEPPALNASANESAERAAAPARAKTGSRAR